MPNQRNFLQAAATVSALVLSLSPVLHAASFVQTNLTSNVPGLAAHTDPNLINPWGLAFSPTSPFWAADQGTGLSTLYDGAGTPQALVVTIPGTAPPSGPTGAVFNGTSDFAIAGGPSRFIFDTLGGTIAAWGAGTTAITEVTTPGAIYTGLALASSGGANYLYAADSTGSIRVFNSAFAPATLAGNFTDPGAIAGFVPFNIQLVGSKLYVTYARLGPGGTPLPGGYVDVFNTDGTFSQRLATDGVLFAPWGITLAPSTFGDFGNDFLIGNFGDGTINAFTASGIFAGTIDGSNGLPLVNDRLWALDFRTGGPNVNTNTLYFTAGIRGETAGLFGAIAPTPEPAPLLLVALGSIALAFFRLRPQRA